MTTVVKAAYTLSEAEEISNRCRASLYEAIGDGKLRAVKSGRRTLILANDLQAWIASWPAIEPKHAAA